MITLFFMRYARESESKEREIHSMEPPFSNYSFFEKIGAPDTLRRIASQVRRMEGKTIVLEYGIGGDDIQDEDDAYESLGLSVNSEVVRISFLKQSKEQVDKAEWDEEDFLGYAIIKKDTFEPKRHCPSNEKPRVFESIIRLPVEHNNYVKKEPQATVRCLEKCISISGYPYFQQNGKTNSCAHVALYTCLFSGLLEKRKSLNDMTRRIFDGKIPFSNGLSLKQMVDAIEALGYSYEIEDYRTEGEHFPFQKVLYGAIESGFPAIIGFSTENSAHAIPIFGHTFNHDTWVPFAEKAYFKPVDGVRYISSSKWVSMYVAHDDNFGSNSCIPQFYLNQATTQNAQQQEVSCVIGIYPKEIKVKPTNAELYGYAALKKILRNISEQSKNLENNKWLERIIRYSRDDQSNRLVLRTRLIKFDEYIKHLENIVGWENERIDSNVIKLLKEHNCFGYVNVVEFSLVELFAGNLRKLGEVVINAEATTDLLVLARLPSWIIVPQSDDSTSEDRFVYGKINIHTHTAVIDK